MGSEMSSAPTPAVALAREMSSHLADGVTDPGEMLERLHSQRPFQWVTLPEVARQMRALTGDTTQLAKQIVRARSAQTMLEVLDEGEPKDKIQVLRSWGPQVNVEERAAGVIVQIGVAAGDVTINLGPAKEKP